jgi:hypothetical protein
MTPKRRRSLLRVLGPALLFVGALFLSGPSAFAQVDHVDGYLSVEGPCLMLRQHDGELLALRGDIRGLVNGDHIRLEGRFAADPGCRAAGFAVTQVQAIWADDNHRSVYFDHLNGEPFMHWAERTGRLPERRTNYGTGYERRDYDRDAFQVQERYDRNGRYVYQGPHRLVTLVGRIHEAAGACPTLHTSYAVFNLDGNLGDYQAGDRVHLSGYLYDGDPNAPCGGPTVVIRSIRGR